jgi:hypothetical protein
MKAYGWQLQDTQIYHQMFGVGGGGGGGGALNGIGCIMLS